jgi:para-nitrobenzyl esterase
MRILSCSSGRRNGELMLLGALFCLPVVSMADKVPTVQVHSGTLQGEALAQGGAAFKGIPYAAAPVGERRWRPPEAVKPWPGIRAATHFGGACEQPAQGWNNSLLPTASEDCLYLNVWTPRLDAAAHLPVMVWIHGGGFIGGAGTDPMFSGEALTKKGVVIVTLNYRLGIFGFLAHSDLSSESKQHASGNYAFRDQIAALDWVRGNISQFGGDPKQITIFGQSAGGGSVITLLTSPLTRGKFQRAIVESGPILGGPPPKSLAEAESLGREFAGPAGVSALRGLSTEEVMRRWASFMSTQPNARFGPIIDGYIIQIDAASAFAQHREIGIPLIIGNNAREGFGRLNEEELAGAIKRFYGDDAAPALALYSSSGESTVPDPLLGSPAAQWLTDSSFRCGAVVTAARHSAAGAPVYAYQFEQSLPGREAEGAAHTYELPYVFGNLLSEGPLSATFGPADRQLSEVIISYWTNFAKNGDPNGEGLVEWPQYKIGNGVFIRLSSAFPNDAKVAEGLRKKQCDLFEKKIDAPAVSQVVH